jgi:hypothetical protein
MNRSHMKTETESSPRNVVLSRPMFNIQNYNITLEFNLRFFKSNILHVIWGQILYATLFHVLCHVLMNCNPAFSNY